jgi:hypothetical protein
MNAEKLKLELRGELNTYLRRDSFEQQFGAEDYQSAALLMIAARLDQLNATVNKLLKSLPAKGGDTP